jgi:hypothetical protein
MFGSNLELPQNRMLSYTSALAKYKSIAPIRGRRDQNTRPLARRGNDNLSIFLEPISDDVIVRLYSTDIIRYVHPAGGDPDLSPIILTPYPSAMTSRILWAILGPHVNPHWAERGYSSPNNVTEVGGRFYHTPSYAVIQPAPPTYTATQPAQSGWTLTDGSVPFEVPYLDRKAGKQALKDSNYYTFKLWLDTQVRLGVARFGHRWGGAFDWAPPEAMAYLRQGETGWVEISSRMSNRVPLESELRSLRDAVYRYEMCYDTEAVPYFESFQSMNNALRRIKNH